MACCCEGKSGGAAFKAVDLTLTPISQTNLERYRVFDKSHLVKPGLNAHLLIQGKTFQVTGNSFDVLDLNQNRKAVYQSRGQFLSWGQKRKVFSLGGVDASPEPLYQMREQRAWFAHNYQVVDGMKRGDREGHEVIGEELLQVHGNCANTQQWTVGVTSQSGHKFQLKSEMSFWSYKGGYIYLQDGEAGDDVVEKDLDNQTTPSVQDGTTTSTRVEQEEKRHIVAKVYSPLSAKNFAFPGQWTARDYVVEIAPGVDAALVLAHVLAYAEMDDDDHHRNK